MKAHYEYGVVKVAPRKYRVAVAKIHHARPARPIGPVFPRMIEAAFAAAAYAERRKAARRK